MPGPLDTSDFGLEIGHCVIKGEHMTKVTLRVDNCYDAVVTPSDKMDGEAFLCCLSQLITSMQVLIKRRNGGNVDG